MRRRLVAVVLALGLGLVAWRLLGSGAANAPEADDAARAAPHGEPLPPGLQPAEVAAGGRTAASAVADVNAPRSEATATYRFHVVADADGKPVAGAEISRGDEAILGVTDANGVLEIRLDRRQFEEATFAVRATGFGLAAATPLRMETCEVRLTPAARIVGTVVMDATGAPVVGARVSVYELQGWRTGEPVATNAVGAFRLEGLREDGQYRVIVHVAGRATTWQDITQFGAEMRFDFRLKDGGILEGTVFDPEGHPLVGVTVTAMDESRGVPPDAIRTPDDPGVAIGAASVHRTATDDRGRYRIEGLRLNRGFVPLAEATPRHVGRGESVQFKTVGDTATRDIRLPAPGALTVIVEGLSEDASRLAQVHVLGDPLTFYGTARDRTSDGAWRFDRMTPGTYDVRLAALGMPLVGRPVDVVAGRTAEVRISFRGSLAVAGEVVSDDGKALPRATVWWRGDTSTVVQANEAGVFRIGGLDDAPGTLVAQPESPSAIAAGRSILENVKPGGPPVRVVIGRAARLQMHPSGLPPDGRIEVEVHAKSFSSYGTHAARLADGGLEVVMDVLGIPLEVTLSTPGFAVVRVETPALASGEVRDLGDVRFDGGRDVAIRLLDVDGTLLHGSMVRVAEAWASDREVTVDASKRARHEHMPRRAFLVSVWAYGFRNLFEIPAEGDGPFEIRLGRGGTLEVHVLDRFGAPAPRSHVRLLPQEEDPYDLERDAASTNFTADGRGVLTTPAQARAYRIRVRSGQGEGEARLSGVVVRPDETTTLTVTLR